MKTKYALSIMAFGTACLLVASGLGLVDPFLSGSSADSSPGGDFAGHHGIWMLLVDDTTRNNFQNMTLSEIEDLRQEKISELQNMTPREIQDLRQQEIEKLDNMTLTEFREMRQQQWESKGPFWRNQGRMPCIGYRR
ncbi:MAG: DUF1104 domain-containing protein [Methanotrichaceae archaeon]|nr:DUF1104 domain-containing protein [Methanotrichaceae archaeon]